MRSSLIHLALALVALVLASTLYGWWYGTVERESSLSAEEVKTIAEKSETEQRAQSIATAFSKLESSKGAVQAYFISENNIVDFLTELEQVGVTTGARVHTLSVSPPRTKSDAVVSVNISIEGSFDATLRTLGAIELAPYALALSGVTMSRSGEGWSLTTTVMVGSTLSSGATPTPATLKPAPPANPLQL